MRSRASFVRAHAQLASPPLVPEVRLHLATEVTPLWHATQAWLDARDLPPPFWAFAWAGGTALARHLLDRPALVRGARVVDFACGGGVVAIAAAQAGASDVLAIDVDPFAVAAARLNARANAVAIRVRRVDPLDRAPPRCDVLLAGDVFYDRAMAARVIPWLRRAAASGARVIAGDPGRAYVPTDGVRVLAAIDVPTAMELEGAPHKTTRLLEVLP